MIPCRLLNIKEATKLSNNFICYLVAASLGEKVKVVSLVALASVYEFCSLVICCHLSQFVVLMYGDPVMLNVLCCDDRCNLASLLILPRLDYIVCALFINMPCPIKINHHQSLR